jgi:DNA-binding NarL/FixJ family response regulator
MLIALARGLSNRAISQELLVIQGTVKFHLYVRSRQLGVSNRLAAANYGHAYGIPAA